MAHKKQLLVLFSSEDEAGCDAREFGSDDFFVEKHCGFDLEEFELDAGVSCGNTAEAAEC
jgi:hypothetical protein